MLHYKLRTLTIALALGPMVLASPWLLSGNQLARDLWWLILIGVIYTVCMISFVRQH